MIIERPGWGVRSFGETGSCHGVPRCRRRSCPRLRHRRRGRRSRRRRAQPSLPHLSSPPLSRLWRPPLSDPVVSTIGSQLFRIRLNPCPGNGWPDLGDMVGPRPPLLRRAAPPVPVPGGHLARPSSRGRQGVGARMVHRRPSGSALDGPPVRHHGPPACRRLSPRAHDRPAVRQRGSIRSSRRSSGQHASPRRRTGTDILDTSTCGALGAGGTR